MNSRVYDVVIATDARLPGGTTGSAAEEIIAQSRAGLRTGLLHLPSSLSTDPRPFAPRLRSLVLEGSCEVVNTTEIHCALLVVRHPKVAAELNPAHLPRVTAERVEIVANQAAGSSSGGTEHYDPRQADDAVSSWTGQRPHWSPIGPLVRSNLVAAAPDLRLEAEDWVNIIDVEAWRAARSAPGRPIRIGRHSRNHPLKWPATAQELLAAYPDHPDIAVHILGGASSPAEVLGGELPGNWRVIPFGGMTPQRFLAGIDLFVYHHHPEWVEAFGRTIIEAMASGAPTILPPHFQPLFKEAATYATTAQTLATIRELAGSPETYRDRSIAAQQAVVERFSHETHLTRLRRRGIAAPSERSNWPEVDVPNPADLLEPERVRVLLVSSNGAGVGHLMRLMAIARRLPNDIEPVVLTLSQAVGVVQDLGYHVEYLPSRGSLNAPHRLWHEMLRARIVELIDDLDIRLVIFDGTWPYDGLLEALEDRSEVLRVWSRRAMWRAEITRHVLHLAPRFDLIIEPGELAGEDDRGATRARRQEAERVGPITFLGTEEMLERGEARRELGLPLEATVALVQLGAGNINDTTSLLGAVLEQLHAVDPNTIVCVTRSAIAVSDSLPDGVRPVSAYPLARIFAAFDVGVAASGYNTFHELLLAHVPTLFIPNVETATDDQLARARWAERQRVAVCVTDPSAKNLRAAMEQLLPARCLADAAAAFHYLPQPSDGGRQAAKLIEELLSDPVAVRARRPIETVTGPAGRPSLRTGARLLVMRLPDPVRRVLLLFWRRVRGRPEGKTGSGRIPVPRGRGFDASTSAGPIHGVLLVLESSIDDTQIDAIVRDVAALQRALGGFAPLFVTSSTHLGPFREHGYGVEILSDPTSITHLTGTTPRTPTERLRGIVNRYDIDRLVTVGTPEHITTRLYPLL